MLLMETRRRSGWRGMAQRAGIACAVVAGHAMVLGLMAWEMRPVAATEVGVEGQIVTASLVAALPAHAASRLAASALKPAVQKQASVAKAQPVVDHDAVTPADPTELAQAVSRPEPVVVPNDTPQLSDADALALEQFEPTSAQGEPNTPCDLTQSLAAALVQSPAVLQGLNELPESERSVANAVMLWDGQWPDESQAGGKALLRALLVKAVSGARADCLIAENRGPVLFFVPENNRTVVLAVGSGVWRWGDLLETTPLQPADYFLTLASALPARP